MFDAFYGIIYELLALTLSIAGITGHCFSIILLSRMLNPINLLLISMSCSQLVLSVNFLFSSFYKYGSTDLCLSFLSSYFWAWIFLISVTFSIIVHMVGVFHVVALSIVRYISLKQLSEMTTNTVWFTYQKCIKTISIIYGSVVVLCVPIYFNSKVTKSDDGPEPRCLERYPQQANQTVYYLSLNEQLHKLNFWWFSIVCKIVPCFLLAIMSVLILKQLKEIREMSARFNNAEKDRQHHRTTKIILLVMIVFILVEFPQGILNIVQSVLDLPHLDIIWDFFELCTLFTSCVIFGLFLAMNSKLREAFVEVFSKNLARLKPCCPLIRTPDSTENRLFEASSTEGCRLTTDAKSLPNYGNTAF